MMLQASTRPATVPGWWRRWPTWSPYAAMAWSVLYGALALSWAAGTPGFPFGEGDPEGAAMGSVLFAAPAEPTGLVMAGWCTAGVIVAGAMGLPTIVGGVGALAITVSGLGFVRLAIIGALGLAPEPAEPPAYTGWATWAPGWLWPFWGIALAAATSAYYHRRHDQGRAAAGPRPGQGAPC